MKWRDALTCDTIQPLRHDDPVFKRLHRAALALLAIFVVVAAALIVSGLIDNKPTTASTGLVMAHRQVAQNWSGWFTEGVWWRNQQTPTPLPFTIHGLFFTVFGYSVRGILILHTLAGAVAAWLLFRIAARRFGPPAGLLAMGLCLAAPLFLYVTFAGWTFVWATLFLLLAIDLTDRAVLDRRAPLFLLAGVALGCAGMSRPENYAAAALFVLFAPFKLRYRAAFLLLAFAYPLAQTVLNNLLWGDAPGLRILDDARSTMSYPALFLEWFGSVRRTILNQNFAPPVQWALLPAVLCFGLPRHRLLAGILTYFCAAFFAAYAMRRISFNHEGYYFAHVVLSMPFLAAALYWLAGRIAAMLPRLHCPPRAARPAAVAVILVLVAGNIATLHASYAARLFYRVPEPVQALRDFLASRLDSDDAIVLDYFAEVSWMLAELEGDAGRPIYYYNANPTGIPRPRLNAIRKDLGDDEIRQVNAWVGDNLRMWTEAQPVDYVVMLSDAAWERETTRKNATGHYRMFGLRPALATLGAEAPLAGLGAGDTGWRVVFENDTFVVYAGKPSWPS